MLDAGSTRVAHIRRIAVVGVDSHQRFHALGLDVLDHYFPWTLTLVAAAVAARSIQLACIHHSESINGDGPFAVVLHHLIFGLLGASTFDECVSGSEDGNGILWGHISTSIQNRHGTHLANITEPDVG